jgi:AraC family transcriptional regulator
MSSRLDPTCLERGHFFGVNRRERHAGAFLLSETHYRGGLTVPPHVHPLPYFGFLLGGSYHEHLGRQSVSFAPLSFVFHPCREVRYGQLGGGGARLFHVEMAPHLIEALGDEGTLPDCSVDCHAGPLVSLSQRLYREFRLADAASDLTIEGISLEIIGALLRSRTRAESARAVWLEQVRDRLHADLAGTLTAGSLAAEVGVSPVRLARAFHRVFGESLGTYHRRLRVRRACERLRERDATLTEVALETGFADQSHFTRVFRRLTGTTPAAYRREHSR